jgi:UDP-N-acetylmuramyl pentapeptide phosphotransferase/UDP-N-acetylglucosamine-1-phosphate transferase
MQIFSAIIAVITAGAGLYYLVYSRGAHRLQGVEEEYYNARRIRLRRTGGAVMLVLAICFALLFWLTPDSGEFLLVLLAVLILVGVILVLAMIDLRLTWRMRRERL